MSSLSSAKHIVIDARVRPSGMGSGRYVDRLLEHLQTIDRTNRYTILLASDDTWRPTAKNFTTVPCPYKRFTFNLLEQVTFGLFVRRLKPDLVHFTMTPLEPMMYFGTRITTAHDLTMFNYVRAGGVPRIVHWTRMLGYRMLFWWSLRLARHVIVPTEFVKTDIAKHYGFTKNKLSVTYESSEPKLSAKAARPKGVSGPFIMHVGSPFPHKNIEGLIDAFALLKQTHPDLQLVLAGKNEKYFQDLQNALIDNPVQGNIVFTGFVSDAELKWLYEHAECYVLPSFSEGFGLTGLEAMVHDCPLASSNASCLPEVFGDAAEYTQDIVRTVNALIGNKKRRAELVKAGHARLKKYSWHRMAKQTLEVYKGTMKR
jgi:glycosyltransferase involved in cell wall biosynthesis